MFSFLFGIAVFALLAACVGGAAYWVFYTFTTDDSFDSEAMSKAFAIGALLASVIAMLFYLAVLSGEVNLTSIADGCYRISSTTSTGFINTGKTITPIVMSGHTYTPIACP